MRVSDLKSNLDKIGVPQELYSIMIGGLPNERLCIVKDEMWQVYYSERGEMVGQRFFETEEEACKYFYQKMKRYANSKL